MRALVASRSTREECARVLWMGGSIVSKGESKIMSVGESKGSDSMKRPEMSKAVYEGWMVRCGRRKIGRSYVHMRYFVLETRLLAYYKRKPQDGMVPVKTLVIDGNCRVEVRGLKTYHGHAVYILCIYNKKEEHQRFTGNTVEELPEQLLSAVRISHIELSSAVVPVFNSYTSAD